MPLVFKTAAVMVLALSALSAQDAPSNPQVQPTSIRIWLEPKESKSLHGDMSSESLLREMNKECVNVIITDNEERADYRLEASHAWCCTPRGEPRGYEFTLFNRDGDAIGSTKTHTFGNAVKDICKLIGRERPK